jgi:hypothetical protein
VLEQTWEKPPLPLWFFVENIARCFGGTDDLLVIILIEVNLLKVSFLTPVIPDLTGLIDLLGLI